MATLPLRLILSISSLLLLLPYVHCDDDDYIEILANSDGDDGPYGTCNQTFHIGKNTVASSDSKRDYYNAYNIFPRIHDQDASHFIDGYCAWQCKLELDDTCFKIHMPQTFQHDEGALSVAVLEKKFTKKWKSVLSDHYPYHYDAFLDFNFAFWVHSLDEYITKWTQFNLYVDLDEQSPDLKLEFIGIQWTNNLNDEDGKPIDLQPADDTLIDNTFYSLLIHSPSSQVNYEFISYTKPSSELYDKVKWIHSDLVRVTFQSMNDPYPWNREDGADIVPVRKSRATSNLNAVHHFYSEMMEANTTYYTPYYLIDDLGGDMVPTRAVTVVLPGTHIELQFIERPWQYTSGTFSIPLYEQLLLETHESVVTSAFCGLDRWMDNHYGFSSWNTEGYFERVLQRLTEYNMKFRIYKSLIEHTTAGSREKLVEYNRTEAYMTFIWEPTGQTIQMGGDLSDKEFTDQIPTWSAQWCYRQCPNGAREGRMNPWHVYVDDEDYDIRNVRVQKIDFVNMMNLNVDEMERKRVRLSALQLWRQHYLYYGYGGVSMCGVLVLYAGYRWMYSWKRRRNEHEKLSSFVVDGYTPLI